MAEQLEALRLEQPQRLWGEFYEWVITFVYPFLLMESCYPVFDIVA